ncbi:MAG: hypothetical protein AAF363_14945 [Bacteroidota bacterium]
MPANRKYLIQSGWTRFSKVMAAILGSLLATYALHIALGYLLDISVILNTSIYSIFIVWVAFMMMVYWIKKAWKSWAILALTIAVSSIVIYAGKTGMI